MCSGFESWPDLHLQPVVLYAQWDKLKAGGVGGEPGLELVLQNPSLLMSELLVQAQWSKELGLNRSEQEQRYGGLLTLSLCYITV